MQYPVIYDIFSRLNRCNSFSCYRARLADISDRRKKSEDRRFARGGPWRGKGQLDLIPDQSVQDEKVHGFELQVC